MYDIDRMGIHQVVEGALNAVNPRLVKYCCILAFEYDNYK